MYKSFFILFFSTITILVQAQVFLNEIVPENGGTFSDDEGDYEDWFEMYNSGTSGINLKNWSITDDGMIGEWKFPEITIPANGHLVVFASEKNLPAPDAEIIYAHHWETAIYDTDTWNFIIPTSAVDVEWNTISYNDADWYSATGGFGYGDFDDGTEIPYGTISVFMRKTFYVEDKTKLTWAILNMDYDDGFVAYLNGVEIARSNMSGIPPAFDELATLAHEALLYQGLLPESFFIEDSLLQTILIDGENVLSVQAHNGDGVSSDLTARPFLHFGIADTSVIYTANPDWYISPPNQSQLHTNFKLSTGETLTLADSNGIIQDEKYIDAIYFGDAIMRNPDGGASWCITSTPSPGLANNDVACATSYTSDPVFSIDAGFYEGTQILTLSTIDVDAQIYFTTNGDIPDASDYLYTEPILINENKIIRARCFSTTGALASNTISNTYFIDENISIAVISIITDSLNLWDYETGIYMLGPGADYYYFPHFGANFWVDKEVNAQIEFFDTAGIKQFEQRIGLEIDGGWGRAFPQKGLFIKADHGIYGEGDIDYPLIPHKPEITEYENIQLSTSGFAQQGFATDALLNRVMENSFVTTSGYAPAIVFLNGEYWGLYEIREKEDEYFLEDNYAANKDSIDILTANSAPEYFLMLHAIEGSDTAFYSMLDFMLTADPTDTTFFDTANTLLDLANITDYFITETWALNWDWIIFQNNNIKLWRSQNPAGPWQYILHDMSIAYYSPFDPTFNYFIDNTNDHALIFAVLMQNTEFRNYFLNRYADLMNTILREEYFSPVMHEMYNEVNAEWQRYYLRWAYGDPTGTFAVYGQYALDSTGLGYLISGIDAFINPRNNFMRNHLQEFYSLNGQVNISLKTNPVNTGIIQINTITPELPWAGVYFDGVPVTVTAFANTGYEFVDWENNPFITDTLLTSFTSNITSNQLFKANFKEVIPEDTSGTDFISEISEKLFSIYPNPVSDFLYVDYQIQKSESVPCNIIDVNGTTVYEGIITTGVNKISMEKFPAGIYTIQIIEEKTQKILKL